MDLLMKDMILQKEKRSSGNYFFSVLIPTWNNLPYLQLCISSIRKNSGRDHQLIVHINEGSDGTLEWVKDQKDIDYTYSKENIGICSAVNAGRNLVSTDHICYMNDDMYACPGWDEAIIKEIEKAKNNLFSFSATMIEPFPGNNCVIFKDFGRDILSFRENDLLKEFASLPMEDWQGATWPPNIVHRDVWDLVKGYSEEFSPGMYSDPDFSMKLWQAGVRLFKGIAASRVYHFGTKSTGRVKTNKGYYTFIDKWKMSSSVFTKKYLRSGEKFSGSLNEPELNSFMKMKNFFSRLSSLLHS